MRKFGREYAILLVVTLFILNACGTRKEQLRFANLKYPKREFRGAWIHTVAQSQYQSMNPDQMKQYFVKMLDDLRATGINAIIFQVRPQADAFYYSEIEPWSRYLTGTQGKAPAGGFDPLAFMVQECHKRNMELHAWLNPYRVGFTNQQFVSNHIYYKYPERFVVYAKQIYFDPGVPENRAHICRVVEDIVRRYDVDAIHMDDYFYPYPVAGEAFPDDNSFSRYGSGQRTKDDWRRDNVNKLIRELKLAIAKNKPWVRFGISPFGIYRNKRSTPDGSGSETNGLQNYDDLYADIKLWVKNGWIDYNMPQIYWEIGHKLADYTTLINWWADNNFKQPLYIGQDVKRTMDAAMPSGDDQLFEKMRLSRSFTTVDGNCFWPGYTIMENYKGVANRLQSDYHKYPSLIPAYTHMHDKSPRNVTKINEIYTEKSHYIEWVSNADAANPETAKYYVVYRFAQGQKEDLNDVRNIVAITRDNRYILPYEGGKNKYKYVVTSVDAFHNESKGKAKKLTL
ncbi:glycoside hydrolase family 10 protein [Viscerimonas tarda]